MGFGVKSELQQGGQFTDVESANNEHRLYVHSVALWTMTFGEEALQSSVLRGKLSDFLIFL